jgi:oxygen-dependent protoporphyrinogen oxidase
MATLILGGGVTGLLAAWQLQKRGEAVEVWEAAAEPGGWVRTLPWNDAQGQAGYVERGPQGVLVAPGSVVETIFKELDLETRSPGHGARWVGKGGRLIPVPSSPPALMFSKLLSLRAKLRLALEPFIKVRAAEPEENLSAFVARRLGREMASELLPAMVAGILAAPPEGLSVDALPKLKTWEASGSLTKGMSGSRSALTVPVGGMGALTKALAARVPGLRCGLRATAIEKTPEGFRVTSDQGEVRDATRLLLALPAYEAVALLGPLAPSSAEALAAIPYTSVRLFHSRHTPLEGMKDGFGFLVHPPEGHGFLGALVPSWIDPACAPPATMQLRSFIGGAFPTDPALQEWKGVEAVLKGWLPALEAPRQVREEFAENAIPRAEMGHRRRVEAALAGLPAGLDWISNARFGPGVRDVAEGLEVWLEGGR